MNKRVAILFLGVLLCALGKAQDPQFSQFYALPTYVSPAFAGTSVQTRFAMAYRNQWPTIPGAFETYNFSYDQYVDKFNSGVGVLATYDKAGSGALRYTNVAVQYAYEIELKRKTYIRPSVQVGYVSHAVDYSKLIFGDQLASGSEVGSHDHLQGQNLNYMDAAAGVLYFTPEYWLGVSLHHLNKPNQSLLFAESEVPRKFSMHGGYRHLIRTRVIQQNEQYLIAAFNYRSQGKYDQLDIGGYYEMEPFSIGLWYRGIPLFKRYDKGHGNSDAVAVSFGYSINDLRIGYSYDATISNLNVGNTGGAHELTLVLELANRRKKRSISKRRVVPCAKF